MAKGIAGRHAVTHYEVIEDVCAARSRRGLLFCGCASRPAARIRSACTSPISATRSWAIRSTRSGFKAKAETSARAGASGRCARSSRQALHAAELGFEHPRPGKPLHFKSALPADIAAVLPTLDPAH